MTSALAGSNDTEKLGSLCGMTYKDQAIWFLNAFWESFASAEAEKLWGYVLKCGELDGKKAEGNALDELNAHRFLEQIGETLTVVSLRDKLRSTGAIGQTERPKVVPLTHYLLFKYGVDWHTLVNSAGDNSEEIAKAQRMLDEVTAAFQEAERQAEYARQQEAPFKAAQEEVDAALSEVNAQEEARNNRTAELERKSKEGGVVQQNKAKAELAQHLAEDPLPLRKAKITLEAALKKAEKARAPFEEARRRAEEAADEARRKVEEVEAYFEEVKSRPGSPHGRIWWMERELQEQKKYLPASKGGVIARK
ncbi:Merozoite surface protein 3a [Balamuthia mandrillaris]